MVSTPTDRDPPLDRPDPGVPRSRLAPVLYPTVYPWYVLMAALDIMVTWVILVLGGHELNVLADWVIQRYDLPGVVSYKFALVVLVIVVCEIVGRRRYDAGLRLARWAVALTAFPVVVGLVHLLTHALDSLA